MIIYSPTFTGSVQITGSQIVTGDFTVQGNLTAQTFILSSSVSYFTESFASGSTRFGDSLDDTMKVTGSLLLTGSGTFNGALSGTSATFSGAVTSTGTLTAGASNGNIRLIGSADGFLGAGASDGKLYLADWATGAKGLSILLSTGAATFSNSVSLGGYLTGQGTNPGGLGGSRYVIDWLSGSMRIFSYGANTSTNGGFVFNSQRSDGSNSFDPMTITSGGNVGIGTSSPSRRLTVPSDGSNWISGVFGGAGGTDVTVIGNLSGGGTIGGHNSTLTAWANMYIYGTNLIFGSDGTTERMRITSGGGVLIATSSSLYGTAGKLEILYAGSTTVGINMKTSTSDGLMMNFLNSSGTQVGYIYSTTTTTQYATTSDYRLKEDFKDSKGLEKVSAIKIYDFKYKNSENRMDGVVAHELQEIIPYAVVGEKDGERMQGVDYSLIVPTLVKAIQEQQIQIQSLQEQINILSNK